MKAHVAVDAAGELHMGYEPVGPQGYGPSKESVKAQEKELEKALNDQKFNEDLRSRYPDIESQESILQYHRAYEQIDDVGAQLMSFAQERIFDAALEQEPDDFVEGMRSGLRELAFSHPEIIFDLDLDLQEHHLRTAKLREMEDEFSAIRKQLLPRLETGAAILSQQESALKSAGRFPSALQPALNFLGGMFNTLRNKGGRNFQSMLEKGRERLGRHREERRTHLRAQREKIEEYQSHAESIGPLLQMQKKKLGEGARHILEGFPPLKEAADHAREEARKRILSLMKSPELKDLERAQEYLDGLKDNETLQFFEGLELDSTVRPTVPLRSKEAIQSELDLLLQAQLTTDLDEAINHMGSSNKDGFHQLRELINRVLIKDRLGSKQGDKLRTFIFNVLKLKMHDFDQNNQEDRVKSSRVNALMGALKGGSSV